MLTSSTLDEDEGSSLGMPAPTNDNARAPSVSDDEEHEEWLGRDSEEWRVVTDGLETQSLNENNGNGLLILDGEEAEEEAHAGNNNNEWGSGLDFSVPGTDSVPTIVGSIDGLPVAAAAASAAAASNTSATLEDDGEKVGTKKIHKQEKISRQEDTVSFVSKSRLALLLVPTAIFFLVPTIASIRLYKERNSLLTSVATLEEEVVRLKDEAKKQKKGELLWNTCGDDSKDTVLVDNCWLTAKANIELGDCASHAKDNILQLSASLSERLALLGNSSWMDSFAFANDNDNSKEEPTEKLFRKMEDSLGKARMRTLGEALWNITKLKEQDEENNVPNASTKSNSFFAKMESSGKSQWKSTLKDAKSVFHTIFPSAEAATAPSANRSNDGVDHIASDSFDDVVQGISDLFAAASSLSVAAGEALVAAAVDTAATAMEEFNQTSLNDIVEFTRQALEEASLSHHQADA